MGFLVAFGYSSFLCVRTKLYILFGMLSLTVTAYGTVEYMEFRAARKVPAVKEEKSQPEKEEVKAEM